MSHQVLWCHFRNPSLGPNLAERPGSKLGTRDFGGWHPGRYRNPPTMRVVTKQPSRTRPLRRRSEWENASKVLQLDPQGIAYRRISTGTLQTPSSPIQLRVTHRSPATPATPPNSPGESLKTPLESDSRKNQGLLVLVKVPTVAKKTSIASPPVSNTRHPGRYRRVHLVRSSSSPASGTTPISRA